MKKLTGKWYFKPKFFGGYNLYVEEKQTSLHYNDKYTYRKATFSELFELGLLHNGMKCQTKYRLEDLLK